MRWIGLVWLSMLAWGLACADDERLQQTVSLQEPAQSVAQLFKTLSERTGVQFFPAPPLDREIILVDAEISHGPRPLGEEDQPITEASSDALAQLEGLFGVEVIYNLLLTLPDGETTLELGSVRDFRPLTEKPTRWQDLPEAIRTQLLKLAREEDY